MWIVIIIFCLLIISIILCGYTTIRVPTRRRVCKTHIACVGDSVTYGCTIPLFFLRRYPAVLQHLLGENVQVASFGVNDRTLQSTGNKPYRKEKAFAQSKEFCPDIVIILLGTNDSKDVNWVSPEAFEQQYSELINEYRTISSNPRIIICTPPCAFKPVNRFFYITNDAKIERVPEIANLVRNVATNNSCELVDLYKLTEGRRELFGPDGLHPSTIGAKAIAEEIYKRIECSPCP